MTPSPAAPGELSLDEVIAVVDPLLSMMTESLVETAALLVQVILPMPVWVLGTEDHPMALPLAIGEESRSDPPLRLVACLREADAQRRAGEGGAYFATEFMHLHTLSGKAERGVVLMGENKHRLFESNDLIKLIAIPVIMSNLSPSHSDLVAFFEATNRFAWKASAYCAGQPEITGLHLLLVRVQPGIRPTLMGVVYGQVPVARHVEALEALHSDCCSLLWMAAFHDGLPPDHALASTLARQPLFYDRSHGWWTRLRRWWKKPTVPMLRFNLGSTPPAR